MIESKQSWSGFVYQVRQVIDFRVSLEVYRGPLDLLLYLVRKHELASLDIPVGEIASQYLEYLEHQTELHVNDVGEFIDLASHLVEMKSRHVLPRQDDGEGAEEEVVATPHDDLVDRLLQYKAAKDAASMLADRGRIWQKRFPRLADDLTPRRVEPASQPIDELEIWDLVNAYNRLAESPKEDRNTTILYDDTPMPVHMQSIWDALRAEGEVDFSAAIAGGIHKAALIGMFLAVLELMRHQLVRVDHLRDDGVLRLTPGPRFAEGIEIAEPTVTG